MPCALLLLRSRGTSGSGDLPYERGCRYGPLRKADPFCVRPRQALGDGVCGACLTGPDTVSGNGGAVSFTPLRLHLGPARAPPDAPGQHPPRPTTHKQPTQPPPGRF